MTLGEQIKQKREEKNLSQEELAEQIGVSRQAVSKWESDLSVPTGANRRLLYQVLPLDVPEAAEAAETGVSKWQRILCVAGWGLAAVLLVLLVYRLFPLNTGTESDLDSSEPALLSIHFYDGIQEEVFPEALWYNMAGIESILIQWTGDTPETVKMFFTPSGSETADQTELLEVKAPADGESALLLSADSLHRDSLMGHLYFELHFGGSQVIVTDNLYNVLYDPMLLHEANNSEE